MEKIYDWDYFIIANAEFEESVKKGTEKAKLIEELLEGRDISRHWKSLIIEQEFVQSGYGIDYFTDKYIRNLSKELRDELAIVKQKYKWGEYQASYQTELGLILRKLLRGEYEKSIEGPDVKQYETIEQRYGKHYMDIHQLHQLGESVYTYFTKELSEVNFITESLLKEGHCERTVRYSMSKIFVKSVWSFLKGA